MNRFEERFTTTLDHFMPIFEKRIPPSDDSESYLLICGDFFDMQKALFKGVSTPNAHKLLQAKSAYIEIFIHLVAYRICDQLGLSPDAILSCYGGGFEILSPTIDIQTLEELRQSFDNFCLSHFYGLGGLRLIWIDCTSDMWHDPKRYRTLRREIEWRMEDARYRMFDLPNRQALLVYDEDIHHQSLCSICNLRKGGDDSICELCRQWIQLGEFLVHNKRVALVRQGGEMEFFDGYGIVLGDSSDAMTSIDFSQRSYCAINEEGEIASLSDLAEQSGQTEHALKALGLLKGEIDGLERFLEQNHLKESSVHYHSLMASLEQFFKHHLSHLMRQSYPNTYMVFAGDRAFFVMGAWDQMIDLAKEVEEDFREFTHQRLSLSMGIVIASPLTSIEYLALSCHSALEASKHFQEESAITLFGETVSWRSYREAKALSHALETAYHHLPGFSMRLIEELLNIVFLRQSMNDPNRMLEGAMWRSRLNYLFQRNIFENLQEDDEESFGVQQLLNMLNHWIEEAPEVCKIVLYESIYQRR
jgi:CRISPR-associated protein Csm1